MSSRKYSAAKKVEVKRVVHQPAPLYSRPPTNRKERRYLARWLKRAATAQGGEQ